MGLMLTLGTAGMAARRWLPHFAFALSAGHAAVAAIPTGMLPRSVKPIAYHLNLWLDPSSPRFSGDEDIDVVLARPTKSIYLNGLGLDVGSVNITASGVHEPGRYRQVDPAGVAVLTFSRPLKAGPATLRIRYTAAFNTSPVGLYRAKDGGAWYSWSEFETVDARRAFVGFDEPGFKTPFTLSIKTPPGIEALATALETGVERAGAFDVHHFATTPPLPTYLLAFAAGPFAIRPGEIAANADRSTPLPLRVVGVQAQTGRSDYIYTETPKLVAKLESFFGGPFPFSKLDQVSGVHRWPVAATFFWLFPR